MEIVIFDNQPIIQFELYDISNKPFKCDFLVDTWFMWSVALIVNKNKSNLLQIIEIFNLVDLEKEQWLEMWNWKKTRTFSANIPINFFWKKENVNILIVEWENDDMPVLWIEFLKMNKKHLSLNFLKKVFKLH